MEEHGEAGHIYHLSVVSRGQEMQPVYKTSVSRKAAPQGTITFQNSATNWTQSVEVHEPNEITWHE